MNTYAESTCGVSGSNLHSTQMKSNSGSCQLSNDSASESEGIYAKGWTQAMCDQQKHLRHWIASKSSGDSSVSLQGTHRNISVSPEELAWCADGERVVIGGRLGREVELAEERLPTGAIGGCQPCSSSLELREMMLFRR
jgi:hypothetical protein